MRSIVIGMCLLAAACGGQGATSPTAPSVAVAAPASGGSAQAEARANTELPLRGSFALATSGVVNCPPTCPPTTLRITGREEGTATVLGAFTATSLDIVDMATATGTGTIELTAANGDQLFATTAGGEDAFIPPNVSHVTLVATIVNGTGRFTGATGTFTWQYTGTIDFASATSTGSGAFEGRINLAK